MTAAGLAVASAGSAQAPTAKADSLPADVTPAVVTKGKSLFEGAGLCGACHGIDGKGAVGPDLTDSLWIHSSGRFQEIVVQILKGVTDRETKSGMPMPPRGGSTLTDEEVRAVAGYVWSLSHPPKTP
jgi:cytochrome c oxidase cbb3-type subunit 3